MKQIQDCSEAANLAFVDIKYKYKISITLKLNFVK